jgi:hypothetical protein
MNCALAFEPIPRCALRIDKHAPQVAAVECVPEARRLCSDAQTRATSPKYIQHSANS